MAETAVDFLLESLKQIRKGETDCPFSAVEMNRIGCLSEEVESLKASLKELEKTHTEHEQVKHLLTEIRDVAYEAADIIDLSFVDHISKAHKIGHVHVFDSHGNLSDVLEKIKFIEKYLMEICEKMLYGPQVGRSSGASASNVGFNQIVSSSGSSAFGSDQIPSSSGASAFGSDQMVSSSAVRDPIVHVFDSHGKLSDVLKEIKLRDQILMEIRENKLYDPQVGSSSGASASNVGFDQIVKEQLTRLEREREIADTAVDLLLENLNQLIKGEIDCPFPLAEMNRVARLYEELQPVRTYFTDSVKNPDALEHVGDAVQVLRRRACEAADIIDVSLVNKISQKKRNLTEKIGIKSIKNYWKLSDVLKEIKSIKKQVMVICDQKLYGIGDPQVGLSFGGSSSRVSAPNVEEEIVVGFDHQVELLKERLTGIQNQLQVVSIVGMAGLGKTTLATKLYNDPYILYHFYIRGWTSVSQVYRKRDLLLGILTSVFVHKDEIYTVSDEKLGENLYKRLKGKRYLVVMDDIWDKGAWNDLKIYFPDDNNGSRILFTSRHTDVAFLANHDGPPHYLRFLNEDESWDLLQKKIFWKESCPLELTDIGKQIAKKCQGLPLAIVVVAGLLAKTDKNEECWKQVAENLRSYIESGAEQWMDILSLSYNNLPYHLKSCFLYLGAFPEDYGISVRKLIWLWIAEGFINRFGHENENKSLEDVAEDYLMDLIDRNLVLVAKRRSTGGIKACRVHDLLHDLCLRKAKEENFLQQIYGNAEVSSSSPFTNKQLLVKNDSKFVDLLRHLFLKKATEESSSSSLVHIGKQHRRLCVNSHAFYYIPSKPFAPHIRSFFCFVSEQTPLPPKSMSFIYPAFKLLRVLDLSAISILSFPSEIVQLFLLRYLALQGKHLRIPKSIGNLQNLEILIISQGEGSIIPNELWNIATLRHLRIAGKNHVNDGYFGYSLLSNLQTISHISPTWCSSLLANTPNLRKLGFCGCFNSDDHVNIWFPRLDFQYRLETLKLLNRSVPHHHGYNLRGTKFPPYLKRLTLSNTTLHWKEMSVLGMLPYLEVLKLEYQACIGSLWETSAGGFCQLKYLRLYYMNVEQWNSSSSHFPCLQHLVLRNCHKLKEIPSEFGDICTLQTIEVTCCSDSAVNSARDIQKEQEDIGNDSLKIVILN